MPPRPAPGPATPSRHRSVALSAAVRLRGQRRVAGGGRSRAGALFTGLGAVVLAVLVLLAGGVGMAGLAGVASIGALSKDLPDPSALETLDFDQPTIVYDRTGKVELARFQQTRRTVVDYRSIPTLVQDATTVAEDRTFWQNDGFDVPAMIAAGIETLNGNGRGASTITQQLVRARLLPQELVAPGADVYLRKAKEIIQSARVTSAFPGETGK